MTPARGETWWAESEDVRRPVMVVTRDAAIRGLDEVAGKELAEGHEKARKQS